MEPTTASESHLVPDIAPAVEIPKLEEEATREPTRRNARAASAFLVYEHPERRGRFAFQIRPGWEGDVPEDQDELRLSFERTSAVLRARFQQREPELFEHYFSILLDLVQVAFNQRTFQMGLIVRQLEQFKEEVVQTEGYRIKNEYLKKLGKAVLTSIVVIMLMSIVIHGLMSYAEYSGSLVISESGKDFKSVFLRGMRLDKDFSMLHFGFLLSGVMVGIWVSFRLRSMDMKFEQLQNPEEDWMRPGNRLTTYGVLALMLALFFHFRVMIVSIGDVFSTARINDNILLAFMIGLCLGFNDKFLPGEVRARVERFFSGAQSSSGAERQTAANHTP